MSVPRSVAVCVCVNVCGTLLGYRTAESSAFLSQLVTQKTVSEVQSIAGQVPAAGGEAMDEIWKSWHHQTIWQLRQGKVGKLIVKCIPLQLTHY